MTDVLVRRCDVRVVRHGGWSWGPEPQRLLDGVLAALPDLLAAELAGLTVPTGSGPVDITRPIRVTVPVTAAELAGWAGRPAGRGRGLHPPAGLLRQAVAAAVAEAAGRSTAPAGKRAHAQADAGAPGLARDPVAALARLLSAALRDGWLAELVAALPTHTVGAWFAALDHGPVGALLMDPTALAAVREAFAARLVRRRPSAPGPGAAAGAPTPPDSVPAMPAGAAEPAPGPPATPEAAPGTPDHAADRPASTIAAAVDPPVGDPGPRPAAGERPFAASPPPELARVAVTHEPAEAAALPYLTLGPLSELGFLDAVAAAFGFAGDEARLPALAAALAYKVLTPPERGWRRAPEDYHRAALFAGLSEALPEPALVDLARDAGDLLAPVAAAVASAVAASRPPTPVVVHEPAAGGVLAATPADLCPLAWSDPDDVAALLAACGRRAAFVGPGGAAPATFAALHRAGISHATDVAPARGERRRRLRGRRGMWGAGDRRAAAAASAQAGRAELLPDVAAALASRPAAPLGQGPALDRVLSTAAGAALATVAARLWGAAEPTDPLLVFERMGDLSARVRVERDRVRVLLPLGRRRADLFAAGLMRDVPGVPWLGGRVVEFGGG